MGKIDGRNRPRRSQWATHVACFAAGVVIATTLGAHAVPGRADSRAGDRYASLDAFAQALSYIRSDYVEEVDEQELLYGAIDGMVAKLDPHSSFLSPTRYQALRQDTEGEFGGVGIRLGDGPDGVDEPVITEILPGSPAARARFAVGDRVVAIDGKTTATTTGERPSPRSWHALLRGPSGSRVEVAALRAGWAKPRAQTLVRERVKVPTIEWSLIDRVGYVAVSKFKDATTADLTAALDAISKQSGGRIEALVLDLRGNPGGLLNQGIRVADLFVADGVLVTVRSRRGSLVEVERAHAAGTFGDFPMVVLIDEGSASAAEIVAGALQDNHRAKVLGVPSYGKGSVQTFIDLADGSGLKLTTSRYYTPSGRSLEGIGVDPDVLVEAFEEVVVAGGAVAAPSPAPSAAVRALPAPLEKRLTQDRQLGAAYEALRGQLDGSRRHAARQKRAR